MESIKLYIIGNGFDLHHGMKTSYPDFCRYVKENDIELANFLEMYFYLDTNKDYLWTNFEKDLGTFDYGLFLDDNDNTEPMHDSFKPSHIYGLEDDLLEQGKQMTKRIKEAFYGWLLEVEYPDENKYPLRLDVNSLFLSFNYTETLRKLYSVSRDNILHIHHAIENYGSDLIFGHNIKLNNEPEFDEYGNSNRTLYSDSESASKMLLYAFYKDTAEIIEWHTGFFDNLSDIDEIIVLGHSLNDIDMPYFDRVSKAVKSSVKWTVSYYSSEEIPRMRQALSKIAKEISFVKLINL